MPGLSAAEAARRLQRFGRNETADARDHSIRNVLAGVAGEPMFLLLLAAAALYLAIGELALRYPGCEIAKNHGLSHGFDIASATIDLYLGTRPRLEYTRSRSVGDLLLPYRAGRVLSHSTREELERMPGVLEAHLGVTVGEVLSPVPPSSFNCVGWVFVEGESARQVEERMRYVVERFELKTDVRD